MPQFSDRPFYLLPVRLESGGCSCNHLAPRAVTGAWADTLGEDRYLPVEVRTAGGEGPEDQVSG